MAARPHCPGRLTRADLYSLEGYAEIRAHFRAETIRHKRTRRQPVGPNATIYFEDRRTIQYQIQEMLRAERIFDRAGIEAELAAYNPLIPDGTNLKATLMLEYPEIEERQRMLERLRGIEHGVWLSAGGAGARFAVADEDLERSNDAKTSAVHFLRFELSTEARASISAGSPISLGLDHEDYRHRVDPVSEAVRESLSRDLA